MNNIQWELGVDGPTMIVQAPTVGWLKDPASMPTGLKQQLDAAGLNAHDYDQILSLNPFASGQTTIDPDRYLPTARSFPYNPPPTAVDSPPTLTLNLQNVATSTTSHSSQVQYGVTVSASVGIEKTWGIKVTGSLQWTNTSTVGTSESSTQTAVATVGGPAFGYRGPADVLVYWDSIYNVFMFEFATTQPVLSGKLTGPGGNAGKEVTLNVGEQEFKTFTDARGEYRFYNTPPGPGRLSVDGHVSPVTIDPGKPVPHKPGLPINKGGPRPH
jgi:hypothetical protein